MSRKFLFSIVLALSSLLGFLNFASAQEGALQKTEINFFYSPTCPHCQEEEKFLDELQKNYPVLQINRFNIFEKDSVDLLKSFYEKFQVKTNEQGYVPVTFTATKYFVGFNNQIAREIEGCLKECLGQSMVVSQKIKVPIFGEIDVSKTSLFAITAVLGILDGFNPCAMWVLVILISLLLGLKSRKKIALVGGTFIFAEGLLYYLFMAAWLNAFLVLNFISIIRIAIGVFGTVFGILRIRDFINWRPGVCKVTEGTKSKGKIMDRINKLMKPTAVPATILGVIALAFGVNLVEFFCSAGFPVMYTKILASQHVGNFSHYLYLLLYLFFYMLDDFIVFGVAFFTLKHFGFSEKYNRYSTLVAGLLILILGILLIFKPQILMFV